MRTTKVACGSVKVSSSKLALSKNRPKTPEYFIHNSRFKILLFGDLQKTPPSLEDVLTTSNGTTFYILVDPGEHGLPETPESIKSMKTCMTFLTDTKGMALRTKTVDKGLEVERVASSPMTSWRRVPTFYLFFHYELAKFLY